MPNLKQLSIESIASGIRLCLINAKELNNESKLLLKNGMLARAFALSVLAREELGKILMLNRTWTFGNDEKEWKSFWFRFRHHVRKLRINVMMNPSAERVKKKTLGKELDTIPPMTQRLKEIALYVDYIDDGFTLPSGVFKEDFVRDYLEVSEKNFLLIDLLFEGKNEEEIVMMLQKLRAHYSKIGLNPPISTEKL